MADQLTLHQRDGLPHDVIDVERHLLNIGLVRERPDAPDHLACPIAVIDNPFHRAARCVHVGSSAAGPARAVRPWGGSGWFTSWAIEAASSPKVVTRTTCARFACASRNAPSTCLR